MSLIVKLNKEKLIILLDCKQMSDLEGKIKNISLKYSQLKRSQNTDQKQKLCDQLISLCVQIQNRLQKQNPRPQIFRWTRQVSDIRTKVIQYSKNNEKMTQSRKNFENESSIIKYIKGVQNKNALSQQQISKKVVRTILQQELNTKNLKVSPSQLQQLALKMQKNLAVMEEIKNLIHDQGNDLDIIQQNIIKAYDASIQTNKQLQQAAKIQLKTRLMKIRLGLTGIFGTIGLALMGIPGAILGLVGGFKLSKLGPNK